MDIQDTLGSVNYCSHRIKEDGTTEVPSGEEWQLNLTYKVFDLGFGILWFLGEQDAVGSSPTSLGLKRVSCELVTGDAQ